MVKFDKEYSTQWKLEYEYLKDNGILPVFVKGITEDNKIITYKYKKTVELFENLLHFYQKIYYK